MKTSTTLKLGTIILVTLVTNLINLTKVFSQNIAPQSTNSATNAVVDSASDNLSNNHQPWNTSFGLVSSNPNDPLFKEAFKSYLGFQANAERHFKDNIYMRAVATWSFGVFTTEDAKFNMSQKEIGVYGLFKFYNLSMGFGPRLVTANLSGKVKTEDQWEQLGTESLSGLGWSFLLEYTFNPQDAFQIVLLGQYSKVLDNEEVINLGTTTFGLGFIF